MPGSEQRSAASAQQDEELAIAGAKALAPTGANASASPAVTYFDNKSVAAAFSKGAVLVDGADRNYMVHASHRDQAGMAEESIKKGKYEKLVQQKIIPHYGKASSIGNLTSFLMQPDLYMTGQVLLCYGGLTLRRDLLR